MPSGFNPLQEKQLAYFKNVQTQLDARKAKVSSVAARRSFLTRQNNANYTNELNRLRGVYSHSNVKTTKDKIEARFKQLTELGAKAVNSIQD
jgi:adenylyl- and sulfurtransferase ThiI